MKKFVYLSILLVTFNAFSQVSEKSKNEKVNMFEEVARLLRNSDNDATAFFKNLTEEDQNLLRALINSSDGKIVGNLSDAVTIASLRNFLKNGGTDAIKLVLAKTEILLAKELSEKSGKYCKK